jgi:hypothetical protein
MSIDIDRHINMIKSFRNAHSECGDYIPYMMPNDEYAYDMEMWLCLPCNELLIVEVVYDRMRGISGEFITCLTKVSDVAIKIASYIHDGQWEKIISAVIVWNGSRCTFTNVQTTGSAERAGVDACVIYGQLQFLSEPTIHADYIDPSPYVQKARADRGKRPLPAYRVIRPGQTVMHYRKGDAAGGTKVEADSESSEKFKGRGKGVPKSPHWNPGCTYAKKNGRIVHKRPYPVKGGKCPNPIPVLALKPNEVQFVSD